MELTEQEKRFLLEVLDKIQVQGLGNIVMVNTVFQKLSVSLAGQPATIEQVTNGEG